MSALPGRKQRLVALAGLNSPATSGSVGLLGGWVRDAGTATVRLWQSTDQVSIGNNAAQAGRKVSVYTTGGNQGLRTVGLATGENALDVFVSGEANARWQVTSTGVMAAGPGGGTALDVTLARGAVADRWELGSGDSLDAIGAGAFENRAAAGDANPRMQLASDGLSLGAGGGSAMDLKLGRAGAGQWEMIGALRPSANGTDLGTTALRWDLFHQTVNGAVREVVAAGADAIQASDHRVYYDPTAGGQAPTLPDVTTVRNREYIIAHVSASGNTVTITPAGGNTINGAATLVLTSYQGAVVYAPTNGTDWKAEVRTTSGAAIVAADRIPYGDGTNQYLSSDNLKYVAASTSFRVGNPTVGANDAGVGIFNGVLRFGTGIQSYGVGTGAVIGNARGSGAVDLQVTRSAATRVASGNLSAILGGSDNTASGSRAVVLGGSANTVSNTDSVAGGDSNTVSGSTSFAFGVVNTVGGTSSAAWGDRNTASATYSTAFGARAVADHYGEFAHASGRFAADGDAQVGELTWRRTTTDGTANVELFLDGAAARYTLADDSTYAFYILLSARRTDADNESAAYEFRGCIDRNAGVTALVGAVTKTVLAEDTAAWDADVVASDPNDALVIQVTGEAAKTIRWVAYGKIVRVSG